MTGLGGGGGGSGSSAGSGRRIVEFTNSSGVSVNCDWTERRFSASQDGRPVADGASDSQGITLSWLDANRQPVVSIPALRYRRRRLLLISSSSRLLGGLSSLMLHVLSGTRPNNESRPVCVWPLSVFFFHHIFFQFDLPFILFSIDIFLFLFSKDSTQQWNSTFSSLPWRSLPARLVSSLCL